jgi:hypothetical protein
METRPTSENSCRAFVDFLCTGLGRNRFEPNFVCPASLGLREASSWPCPTSAFRCLVRLVCRSRYTIVSAREEHWARSKNVATRSPEAMISSRLTNRCSQPLADKVSRTSDRFLFFAGYFSSCRPPSFHQLGESLSSRWCESAFLSRCVADAGTFSLRPSCFCGGGEFCSRCG